MLYIGLIGRHSNAIQALNSAGVAGHVDDDNAYQDLISAIHVL